MKTKILFDMLVLPLLCVFAASPSPTSYGASNILKKKLPLDVGGGEQSML